MLDISYFSFNNLFYKHTFNDLTIDIYREGFYTVHCVDIISSNEDLFFSKNNKYIKMFPYYVPENRIFPEIEIDGKLNPILLKNTISNDIFQVRNMYTGNIVYEITFLLFMDNISPVGYKILINKKD